MEGQSKLKEVVIKEVKKIKEKKEKKKCKHDIFDFACIIAEYNRVKIPSKVLKEISVAPYYGARNSSTV